jgi:hypothetical protein
MVDLLELLLRLEKGDYSNWTLEECIALVELLPDQIAPIIKKLHSQNMCTFCRQRTTEQLTAIDIRSILHHLCEECFALWYYSKI